MKSKIHILCPEYVPLENKGEEAIIRGTIDVVFPEYNCEYHIIDTNNKSYSFKNGIHIYPGSLFFSNWRSQEFGLGLSWERIYASACSLLRNGLNKFFPFWISKPHKQAKVLKEYLSGKRIVPKKYLESIDQLKKVEFIIAGHNGGLDEYVCHILNELHSVNIPFGIFGSSMKPNLKEKAILNVFEKTFASSKFNIARNPIGYEWANKNFPNQQFELKPDPAFGMIPEDKSKIEELIKDQALGIYFKKPVIMFTTAEPAPIARYSFEKSIGTVQKLNAHRAFLAQTLKLIHDNHDVNILFLPHTIGPEIKMDDRVIASDVIKKAGLQSSNRIKLLMGDFTAKQLKGLIAKADFLVAERVHSIIGAIGVNTPFMCLASKHDTRVNGILKIQMKLGNYIYYLADPNSQEAFEKFNLLYDQRMNSVTKLKKLNKTIDQELTSSGRKIFDIIID